MGEPNPPPTEAAVNGDKVKSQFLDVSIHTLICEKKKKKKKPAGTFLRIPEAIHKMPVGKRPALMPKQE